jgi:hypothetical protein
MSATATRQCCFQVAGIHLAGRQVSWNWREPSAKASRTTCLQGRMDQRHTLPKWRAQLAYECKRMGPWLLAMHAMRCV